MNKPILELCYQHAWRGFPIPAAIQERINGMFKLPMITRFVYTYNGWKIIPFQSELYDRQKAALEYFLDEYFIMIMDRR